MPDTSRPGRKKRWHHKDFNGCMKCKQRRVKCGLEKPACLRCQKLGVLCPGYRPLQIRIFELTRRRDDFQCEEDVANFDYFVESGSKIVALSQTTSQPFWSRFVLQLAETNAIIKHGLIALGALLRPLHAIPSSQKYDTICPPQAATKHSAAMYQLKSAALGALPPEAAIACCLVSAELDRWTEKSTSPVLQIMLAYRLLEGRSRANAAAPSTTKDDCQQLFEPMVDELLVDACSSADNFPTLTSGLMSNYQLASGLNRVESITTYMDALHSVASLLKAAFRSTCPYIVATAAEMDKISLTMDTLGHKLQHFHAVGEVPVEYQLLQVHHQVARIMFYTLGRDDEWIYDAFLPNFASIVEQMQHITSSLKMMRAQSAIAPTLGLIPPLFLVATKCRHPEVRQKALHLLHGVLRSERGWTSCMSAAISQFVIREETKEGEEQPQPCAGTLQNHPDNLYGNSLPERRPRRRIRLDEVEFSSRENKIYLAYTVYSSNPNNSPGSKRIASIPYLSHPSLETNNSTTTCQMSRKVLRHCGYTGVVLFSPQIECHCVVRSDSSPSVRNRVDEVRLQDLWHRIV
ncbi:uncharacterized protein Z520_09361 [Fonsecaea multimorphosa CBS 102226]|uniref:Zn(2)-C6 fungal-type domain-containing protein n=1 Tax=Fonsecaea multimorphosa CBS 102226 TaxID=1442371 RepID=A0A0D2ID55_9EURO|nr:uncharacterized protein Z520_09361 [Fonsecaea multimorphosa CBS 102226]KIX95051.1 hypothetical protein Z520_09361 [Fonsecaea multimorphosa CBS 102226]OAL20695.1 hypothetical protein AYO22_08704 [Fonsecaea multimorphosa]